MNSNMISIVILAGVALFLVLQLRKALGTRDGYEPPKSEGLPKAGATDKSRSFEVIQGGGEDFDITAFVEADSPSGRALTAMKSVEPDFTVSDFANGAKSAYEMILMAFENDDLESVKDFLSEDVYDSFAAALEARRAEGLSVSADFMGVSETKLKEAEFDTNTRTAEITMRFTGEMTSVVRNADGEVVEGDTQTTKRQRDTWTFARGMGVDDPNWQLIATE